MSIDRCTRVSLAAVFIGAATNTVNVSSAFSSSEVTPMPTKQYVLDWGGGAVFKPKYPGADSYLLYPFPIISIGRFYVPGLGQVVDGEQVIRGFYFYPSFDFNGERKPSDSPDLTGTDKVDWALELGIGAGYRYDWLRGFIELRQGINGHEGQVAEFGMDFIFNPAAHVELIFGPRASWASDNYMNTYFGVTAAEAAAPGSSLSAFNANSSFKTVGLAMRANYSWSENTTFHLQGGWDRFVGDAAKSPIVNSGSSDQFSIGLGASYRFAFDLFD